jgi:hypothetical protein
MARRGRNQILDLDAFDKPSTSFGFWIEEKEAISKS